MAKPASWVFATLDAEEANRRRVSVSNEATDEQLRRAAAPLVVILRHPLPYDKVNPTVKVVLRPAGSLGAKSPREIGSTLAREMQRAIPGFELEGEVSEVMVGGRRGAHFRARFLVADIERGMKYAVLSRTWIVPRGDELFLIGMSGPTEGEDLSEAEFKQILESIEIGD